MKSRQFPSYEEAKKYLEERGTLQYFGRAGINYEYCVYTLTLHNGIKYHLSVYDDGKVEIRE